MKTAAKVIALLIVIIVGANIYRVVSTKMKENKVAEKADQFLNDATGLSNVNRYIEIRDKADSFNFPTIKKGISMYYIDHGRYPASMDELESGGVVPSDAARDRFGNKYSLKYEEKTVILSSAGKDKIKGTADDVEYRLPLD